MPQFCTYICCPVTPRAGWRGTGAMTSTFEEISPFSICFSLSFSILPFQPHQHQLLGLTTLKLSICAWAPHVLFIFISPLTRIKILWVLWRGQKSNLWPVGSKETLHKHLTLTNIRDGTVDIRTWSCSSVRRQRRPEHGHRFVSGATSAWNSKLPSVQDKKTVIWIQSCGR